MKVENTEQLADIVVIGLAVRTSFAGAATDIPALWQRVMREGSIEKVPRRAGDTNVYALYTDYESDYRGAYTMIIGVAVEADAATPAGMQLAVIPAGAYATVRAEGPPQEAIWGAWHFFWEEWPQRSERRYAADFERYDPAALAGFAQNHVAVDVVVGISPAP
jgi:predicted transcriptional regulator YdeE